MHAMSVRWQSVGDGESSQDVSLSDITVVDCHHRGGSTADFEDVYATVCASFGVKNWALATLAPPSDSTDTKPHTMSSTSVELTATNSVSDTPTMA